MIAKLLLTGGLVSSLLLTPTPSVISQQAAQNLSIKAAYELKVDKSYSPRIGGNVDIPVKTVMREKPKSIKVPKLTVSAPKLEPIQSTAKSEKLYNINEFEVQGIVFFDAYKYSYYSESVLPGGGLKIPGRHVQDGFVSDEDRYIVLAANAFPKGSIHPTPFGRDGKVYDYCEGCSNNQLNVYTR